MKIKIRQLWFHVKTENQTMPKNYERLATLASRFPMKKKAYISTYFTVLLGVTCKLAVGFIIRTALASLACWKNESGTQKSETASGSSSKGSSKSDVLSLRSIQWCATLSSRTSSYLRKKKNNTDTGRQFENFEFWQLMQLQSTDPGRLFGISHFVNCCKCKIMLP